jgi:hypothetical protein
VRERRSESTSLSLTVERERTHERAGLEHPILPLVKMTGRSAAARPK